MIIDSRKKKLLLNTVTSVAYQILAVVLGFILPKMFLNYYGSEINGLVSSITQFLGFIALMELGIGAVVQSVLYQPLVTKNNERISQIIRSSQRFFNRIAMFFLLYIIILSFIYPKVNNEFNPYYSSGLIIIIAISSIAQYFFGINNQLLLMADQRIYVSNFISIFTLILNTIVSIIFIVNGYGIHMVKLASATVLVLRPILLKIYVDKHYHLIKNIEYSEEPIKQKWNGIAQHLASFVLNNTDVFLLTIFSGLTKVSIYVIYKLITNGLQQVIISLTAGIQSLFGHMLANNEFDNLKSKFLQFEWLVHTLVVLIFSCTSVLIVPFVTIYTKGISDANYIQPVFGLVLTISVAMYSIRLPYNIIVLAAGHFKETQLSAFVEMILNIVISLLLVRKFDITGVAVGTLVAMTYRTIYFAKYLPNIIKDYKFNEFIKHIIVDTLTFLFIIKVASFFSISSDNYFEWIISAIQVFLFSLMTTMIINMIFYRKQVLNNLKVLFNKNTF